jgi:hypothetical protein
MNTKQLSKENLHIMHKLLLPDVKVGIWVARRIMGPVLYIEIKSREDASQIHIGQ